MKFHIFYLFLIAATFSLKAQNFDQKKLDNYFDELWLNNKFSGSVAVSKSGKIIYRKSVGFTDVEKQIKADSNTIYRIGSISKTFTSVLIFKTIENKKLTLDDKLSRFFPEIKNAENITVAHLLNHHSGIANFTERADYTSFHQSPKSEVDLLKLIVDSEPEFEPGKQAKYSNSNYVLLTFILQKVWKKSYAELLTQFITKPLKLKRTGIFGKIDSSKNQAFSYDFQNEWVKSTETDVSIPLGAGAISSSPSEMTVFADNLFSGKIISKESLEQMKKLTDNFGFGLFPFNFDQKRSFGHTGGIDGFHSVFSNFENDDVSIAVFSNGLNYNFNIVSLTVLKAVFNKPFQIPDFKTIQLDLETLKSYEGNYSSAQIPLKINVFVENNILKAQASGQSSFPLEPFEKDKFKFDPAGIELEFNVNEKSLVLKQGGGVLLFNKQ